MRSKNSSISQLSFIYFLFLFYILIWWLQLGERIGNRIGYDIRIEAVVAFILLIFSPLYLNKTKPGDKAGFSPFVIALFFIMLTQVIFAWNTERAWYIFTERVLKYSGNGSFY